MVVEGRLISEFRVQCTAPRLFPDEKNPDSSGDWSIMSERYLILAFQTGAKLWRRVCMPLLSRAGAGCQGRDSDERTRAQFLFSALQRWHSGHSVISTFYLQKRPILKENSQAQHRSFLQKKPYYGTGNLPFATRGAHSCVLQPSSMWKKPNEAAAAALSRR